MDTIFLESVLRSYCTKEVCGLFMFGALCLLFAYLTVYVFRLNTHKVPRDTLKKMKERYQHNLTVEGILGHKFTKDAKG